MPSDIPPRYLTIADDKDKLEAMVSSLRLARNKQELNDLALIYVLDLSYSRADICLAMKIVERT